MEILSTLIDFILHIDTHLHTLTQTYANWTYLILFGVIFVETGLVVMPFLPGDSLLFAAGSLAALGSLNLIWLLLLLSAAAILGDTVNYWIGHQIGMRAFNGNIRWLNPAHLKRTELFFAKHGGKAIILARFVPIVRTFAPFVAGIGSMTYAVFLLFNVIGGVTWVILFVMLGYLFGGLPIVQDNFHLVLPAIILLSLLPIVYEAVQARRKNVISKEVNGA
ncbi:MAG: DedA family protein [Candidatus Promineifilaceae bacterium]|nr:DedA family protein [Anaerolineaceae bacterium]